ncbi:MAG TPA: GTPase ObgE [Anaerolineae bacterium]|nr:GTPase ObgE [Anaerolineae bacterium]
MFFDEARIFVSSGRGGNGVVHFRREKYVPLGGPDGGNGGKGGDVILEVAPTLNTLSAFRRRRRFHAADGGHGGGNNKSGRNGTDEIIHVPPGTVVRDENSGELLGDLVQPAQRLVVCNGGRGGRGNARFATSRNQAPRVAEKGEPCQERWLLLELRLIADIGIVGVPNAGKSTLLAAVTNARPKIADYPFTTLQPNLGVAELDNEVTLVLADIPGLIEGAHAGEGLGFAFLRHIQRTRVLIHLIDGSSVDPLADFSQVNTELALFDKRLTEKPVLVAVNKLDLPDVKTRWPDLEAQFSQRGYDPLPISALAREGLRKLLYKAHEALQKAESHEVMQEELPVYRSEPDPTEFEVSQETDGGWRVSGVAIERAAHMTYWEYDEAVRRFQRLLERMGVEDALRQAGAKSGDTVRIGEYELEWLD